MFVTAVYLIAAASAGWMPVWNLMLITAVIDVVFIFGMFGNNGSDGEEQDEENMALTADDLEDTE